MSLQIKFRDFDLYDLDFIYSSYLKSYRTAGDNTRMSNDTYFYGYTKVIKSLLKRAKCLLAVNPEDENQIYGYIIYEWVDDIPVIHYIYVKFVFRLMGIGRELVNHSIGPAIQDIVVSHVNKFYDTIKKDKELQIHYNPFLRFYENKRD